MGRVVVGLLLIVLVLAAAAYWAYGQWEQALTAVTAGAVDSVLVEIPAGTSSGQVADLLEDRGLIRSSWAFRMLSRLRELDAELQAGWYRLSPEMTPEEILEVLVRGEVATVRFTVVEGLTVGMITASLVSQGMGDEDVFSSLVMDASLVQEWLPEGYAAGVMCPEFELPASPLEGYLFPDTYDIRYPATEQQIIEMMIGRFRSIWSGERLERAEQLGLSVHEIVTLASIVEREAVLSEERELVASVFMNRLEIGMKLDACSTVLYVHGRRDGVVRTEDTEVESPYNTYRSPSLPPGPIATPSLASIDAVLYPAETDYLYFVSRGDGSHAFSRTYAEHLANVRRYLP